MQKWTAGACRPLRVQALEQAALVLATEHEAQGPLTQVQVQEQAQGVRAWLPASPLTLQLLQ